LSPQEPSPLAGSPPAEVEIDATLVRSLLHDQQPDLAHLPLQLIDVGWDNAMFRLGDQFLVRLPRRRLAASLIENEQRWLPAIAARLPIAIPAPVRVGQPGRGYPWKWSVLPWLQGDTADRDQPHADQALRLAQFLRALHIQAPDDAPINEVRGVPLSHRADVIEARLRRLESVTHLITSDIRLAWRQALEAPIAEEATWLHGDLHPRNILVENSVISGIIDWGDITSGDAATDLACIWMLFAERACRQQALQAYGAISEAMRRRARGWAVLFGVVLLETGLTDHPQHMAIGQNTLARIAEDIALE
jgi:aminoglycoside phosphotransferase (APT) family kinase protein